MSDLQPLLNNETVGKSQITIEDVARQAGVSTSTVSRVLNNSAPVSRVTKKKILKVIEELHFTPNAMARGLVKKSSKTLGLMIPEITNPFFLELIKGVEDVASRHGFSMFLCSTNRVPEKEEYYINEMLERRTNGLMLISTHINNKKMINRVKKLVEIVSVQSDIEDVDRVDTTDEQGVASVMEHLIELGHRKIAFVGYRFDVTSTRNRLLGYQRTLERHSLPLRKEYFNETDSVENPGYALTKQLLELKDRPTAIHCMTDYLAMGAYMAINESKLRIPADISVTGFDNIVISQLMAPTLTTVAQPIYQMGETAAELLIKNIAEGSKSVKQSIVIPTQLVVRGSSAPPKA